MYYLFLVPEEEGPDEELGPDEGPLEGPLEGPVEGPVEGPDEGLGPAEPGVGFNGLYPSPAPPKNQRSDK
jgi:hypothetical protein